MTQPESSLPVSTHRSAHFKCLPLFTFVLQVYIIKVSWSDGSTEVIYRRYSKFFDLQVRKREHGFVYAVVVFTVDVRCCIFEQAWDIAGLNVSSGKDGNAPGKAWKFPVRTKVSLSMHNTCSQSLPTPPIGDL